MPPRNALERTSPVQIATTLRIIIEQSLEWQSTLYLNFIDFEKAIDSVDRKWTGSCRRQLKIIVRKESSDELSLSVWKASTLQTIYASCLRSMRICSSRQIRLQKKQQRHAGLKVNIEKTQVMQLHNKQQTPVTLGEHNLKDVDSFTYLGSIVTATGGTDEDIKARINKARHVFITLKSVWSSTALSTRIKIRIYNTNHIESGGELHIPSENHQETLHSTQWNPQGVERPRKTWRRSCEEEIRQCGHTWEQPKKAAQNRVRWRTVAEALCTTRNQKEP
ncbi:uncharacterized protein LOC134262290 [Saccostrea cucullata]|uniref:uncharacterized protein LOC134262290 n=1 Tax=Saccostrea cuccullata TaxID=36930 RepID=UPI002ECFE15D